VIILEHEGIVDRIRISAANTDKLIVRLDNLISRIDTAKSNENAELVEYYERQFAEASVEFLDGVESILDDWYALKGEERPPMQDEYISPEMLDSIHNTVISIVQGLPVDLQAPIPAPEPSAPESETPETYTTSPPRHKVDVTG
jgi:hypothetical protein